MSQTTTLILLPQTAWSATVDNGNAYTVVGDEQPAASYIITPRALQTVNINLNQGSIIVHEPATYLETIQAVLEATGVVTDSGGLQKEAYLSQTPCLTIRKETEWLETLNGGWNKLDPNLDLITSNWWELTSDYASYEIFGDGNTSKKILDAVLSI
jgi:UDP-N-acetylglucosamine 2-epimerase (non-hydrolysing)